MLTGHVLLWPESGSWQRCGRETGSDVVVNIVPVDINFIWRWWKVLVLLRISLMVVPTVVSSPFSGSDRNLIIIGVITTGFRSLYTRTFIQTGVHRSAVKVHSSQRSRLVVVSGFYSTVSRICTRSTAVKLVLNNLSFIDVKGVKLSFFMNIPNYEIRRQYLIFTPNTTLKNWVI